MINESGCGEFIKPDDSFEIAMKIFKYQSMKKSERKKIGLRGKKWILKNRNYQNLSNIYIDILNSIV